MDDLDVVVDSVVVVLEFGVVLLLGVECVGLVDEGFAQPLHCLLDIIIELGNQ